MANYQIKPNSSAEHELLSYALAMLDRTLTLRTMDFPLTCQEALRTGWTDEQEAALDLMVKSDVWISKTAYMAFRVQHPTIERLTVRIMVRDQVSSRTFPNFNQDVGPMMNLDRLPPDKAEAFLDWLVPAIEWARKIDTAKKIISAFVRTYSGGSLASINKRWPGFLVVPLSMSAPWPDRVRAIGKVVMSSYDWSPGLHMDWYADNMDKLSAVTAILTQAQMLGRVENKAPVVTSIENWTWAEPDA